MSTARDLPFYIVTDQGDVWATHACPGGTSSTFYGKHDAVVQELSDKIAALEKCVKAADAFLIHDKKHHDSPQKNCCKWCDALLEYRTARAEVNK